MLLFVLLLWLIFLFCLILFIFLFDGLFHFLLFFHFLFFLINLIDNFQFIWQDSFEDFDKLIKLYVQCVIGFFLEVIAQFIPVPYLLSLLRFDFLGFGRFFWFIHLIDVLEWRLWYWTFRIPSFGWVSLWVAFFCVVLWPFHSFCLESRFWHSFRINKVEILAKEHEIVQIKIGNSGVKLIKSAFRRIFMLTDVVKFWIQATVELEQLLQTYSLHMILRLSLFIFNNKFHFLNVFCLWSLR